MKKLAHLKDAAPGERERIKTPDGLEKERGLVSPDLRTPTKSQQAQGRLRHPISLWV